MSALPSPEAPDPVSRVVRERRSIRTFLQVPVAHAVVDQLLREAIWAPSPHNSQPWRFTVLFEHEEKARLANAMAAQLAVDLATDGLPDDVIAAQTGRSCWRLTTAPVLILCSLVSDGLIAYPDHKRASLEWEMAVQSVGAVLQTLFLLATTHGLGSCWMAAPMYCPIAVREALDLPDDFVPQALVLMGYPGDRGRIRERRAFEEIVDLR